MDRWIFWPVFASLGTVFVVTLVCGIPGTVSFFLLLFALPVYAVAAAVLLIVAAILAMKRRPRRAASLLVALVVPVFLWAPIDRAAEYAHLALTAGFGIGGQLGPSTEDGFEVADWSVGLAGGPNTFLIRDKTDRIALPPTQASLATKEGGFTEECAGKARRLAGHYYVCTF